MTSFSPSLWALGLDRLEGSAEAALCGEDVRAARQAAADGQGHLGRVRRGLLGGPLGGPLGGAPGAGGPLRGLITRGPAVRGARRAVGGETPADGGEGVARGRGGRSVWPAGQDPGRRGGHCARQTRMRAVARLPGQGRAWALGGCRRRPRRGCRLYVVTNSSDEEPRHEPAAGGTLVTYLRPACSTACLLHAPPWVRKGRRRRRRHKSRAEGAHTPT